MGFGYGAREGGGAYSTSMFFVDVSFHLMGGVGTVRRGNQRDRGERDKYGEVE